MKNSKTRAYFRHILWVAGIAFICLPFSLQAQFLSDPSFEGPGGENMPPPDWQVCENQVNHPDGGDHSQIAVDLPASDGSTYLTMRVRDSWPPTPENYFDTREFCYTQLLQPLEQNHCYQMQVDLAYDDSVLYFSDYVYVLPTTFRVWGTIDGCNGYELLYETPPVTHKDWETYEFIITPEENTYDLLYIEPYYTGDTTYVGMLLVDNMRITSDAVTGPFPMLDTLLWPGDTITLSASEGFRYEWEPFPGLSCWNCQEPLHTAHIATTHEVTIYPQDDGCPRLETFSIGIQTCENLYPEERILRLDTTIEYQTTLSLRASQGISYEWMQDGVALLDNNSSRDFEVDKSTLIECIVTENHGCKFTDVFRVEVPISYPNVITPDGNGRNDVFRVKGLPDGTRFQVFSRANELVYSTRSYSNNWSGLDSNGKALPEDTYWFILTNEKLGVEERGFILLKR